MSNTKDTGFLRNLISYDASGNITLPANLTVTGSLLANGGGSYATQSYVTTQISNLVNAAPGALDTLNELAAALGNDANFSTTVTNSLASKQAALSGTGFVKISGTTISYDNNTYLTTSLASSTYLPLVGGTLTGALNGTSATFSSQVLVNLTNGYAFSLNRPATTNYIGISYRTNNAFYWFVGMRENSTNDYIVYNEATSIDNLRISNSTGSATFSGSVTAGSGGTVKPQFIADGGSSLGAGMLFNTGLSGVDRRNWFVGTEENIAGDFVIKSSNAAGGSGQSGTTRFAILNSGNIGIGTTSPSSKLHIYQTSATDVYLESGTSGTSGKLIFKTSDNSDLNKYIAQESYYMVLSGNSNEGFKFRDSSGTILMNIFGTTNAYAGRVGIGTTTPAYNLSVASYLGVGAQGGGDIVLIGGGSGVGAFIQLRYATGTTNVHLAGNGNSYLNSSYGNVGIGTTNPANMLSVQGEIAKYCTVSGVDGNFQNLIKYGYFSDLQSGSSLANRWIGIDATVTAGAAVTNTLRIRAYAGGGGNAVPANVADFRGDQSSVFYGYIKHNTRVFSANSYIGNLSPNLNTAYTRNYLLVCNLNDAAGFSLSGQMNAASYTCWNISTFWIMKNYSSTNGTAGITGMYKGGGCDMNIVDLNYAGGRYIAIGYTSNPEVNGMWIGYRVNHMLNADGTGIVVPDSSVSINSTYASY